MLFFTPPEVQRTNETWKMNKINIKNFQQKIKKKHEGKFKMNKKIKNKIKIETVEIPQNKVNFSTNNYHN